ncbi:amine oxidase [Diplogelasinospora grovesii]|uniref:Amine oxidase n=1 Tax=Diplogelasinospora grovesii TaxID=303347 RepID=A0AAN6S9N9_9PEZI|nr:amine oxidase [Diplogelasinospora grovesii]
MTTRPVNAVPRKKVAIVGSGCAGIAALWALNRTHHDVYLYEAADRLGGHTNTVEWVKGKYRTMVDTGFIVMNTATYPNFIRFLEKIRVRTAPTEMTFAVSRDQGLFEWAGTSLDAVFCQRGNIFSPRMWRMIFDIIRFNQSALDVLIADETESQSASDTVNSVKSEETIGEYLEREGYSEAFRDDYLIPMTAAVWSTSPDKCTLEFPAVTLIRFLWNHHLLSTVAARPAWLTIPEGSKSYIDAVMKGFPSNHLFLNTKVKSLTNDADGRVRLHLENGKTAVYDHVILATHGDQAYSIIHDSATEDELDIMSNFRTSENKAVLHSDLSQMPESRKAWSSWNYMTKSSPLTGRGNIDQVSLTYNMNILQHIPTSAFGDVLVTLNPLHEPDPKTVQGRFTYAHALYTPAAIRAQQRLPEIQNTRGISYAGAWTKYGFHEDGFSSGLHVAKEHLGARLPFEFKDSTYSRGKRPELGMADRLLRLWIFAVQLLLIDLIDRIVVEPLLSGTGQRYAATMNSIFPRFGWRLSETTTRWSCQTCRRAQQQQAAARWRQSSRGSASSNGARRFISQSSPRRAQPSASPSMEHMRDVYKKRNRTTMFYTLSVILGTVALSYGSVPMYKMVCLPSSGGSRRVGFSPRWTTGFGGQPVRAHGAGGTSTPDDLASRLVPVTDAKRIRVTFNASVSDVLPWKFVPQQREVRVLPGETALAFYTATNKSDQDIIGVATYSVTPGQTAPYFSKIQCFCFEEQRLAAGETVDMPVFFYLDPDMLNDLNMRGIETVTLSYTFFKAKYDNNGNFKNIPEPPA